MKITARILKSKGACTDQVALFASLFPKGVQVTEALCLEHADKFNWSWAAQKLLPASARAEYERIVASARAEYARTEAPAWAEYERAEAPAWAEYERVRASARAEYERVRASAFGRLAEGL